MKLIENEELNILKEKITVEMTVEELMAINAVFGGQNRETVIKAVKKDDSILPVYRERFDDLGVSHGIYFDSYDILKKKGIYNESI